MAGNRRKKLMISRKFQMTLIAKVSVVNIISGLVFGIIIYFGISNIINSGNSSAGLNLKNISDLILPLIILVSLSGMIFTVISSAYIVLSASNKISGPLFRLNSSLKNITEGDLSTMISIRENDETKESYESLEILRKSLWNDFSIIREKLEIIKHKAGKKPSAEMIAAINEIEKAAGKYRF